MDSLPECDICILHTEPVLPKWRAFLIKIMKTVSKKLNLIFSLELYFENYYNKNEGTI